VVRAAIGDEAARKVKRKRGLRGQLEILKTLLHQCPDLFSQQKLELYFFHEKVLSVYDHLPLERTDGVSEVFLHQVSSVEEMPFYPTRNLHHRQNGSAHDDDVPEDFMVEESSDNPYDCVWCRRAIPRLHLESCFRCKDCGGLLHEVCADLYFSKKEQVCPTCGASIEADFLDEERDMYKDFEDYTVTRAADDSFESNSIVADAEEGRSLAIKDTKCLRSRVDDRTTIDYLEVDSSDDDFPSFDSPGSSSNGSEDPRKMSTITASPGRQSFLQLHSSIRSSSEFVFLSPLDPEKYQNIIASSPADASSCRAMRMSPPTKGCMVNQGLPNERDRTVICIDDDTDTDSSSSSFLDETPAPSDLLTRPGRPEVIDMCSP
jgi:hypothetical protein